MRQFWIIKAAEWIFWTCIFLPERVFTEKNKNKHHSKVINSSLHLELKSNKRSWLYRRKNSYVEVRNYRENRCNWWNIMYRYIYEKWRFQNFWYANKFDQLTGRHFFIAISCHTVIKHSIAKLEKHGFLEKVKIQSKISIYTSL